MDIGWLQDFLTLAETRNFTKAGERRNSSQAAFSRRIQALETWLGMPLVDRTTFPVELTAEGYRFCEHARDVLAQLFDARISLAQGAMARHGHVSIALPHALGSGRFSSWWLKWSQGMALSCTILPGNVGDAVNALISGAADILIYYHNPQQPLHLDHLRYSQIVVGSETLRPYGARHLVKSGKLSLPPASSDEPVPVLSYGAESYLARVVDTILDHQPTQLRRVSVASCNMAEILREMAIAGQGIAWLPESVLAGCTDKLEPVGDERWTMSLSIIAYRDRHHESAALDRLWQQIKDLHPQSRPKVPPQGKRPARGRVHGTPSPRRKTQFRGKTMETR
ncbi:LysR family transcriptional regulator [Pelagibacterium sp. H642]|uniref:LysR family transcriptional regulator n=1 Tax=Pelagibacterium sp. H642 TaxID=1881069 RepID=UPI00281566EA|nr:LysR family transcriptional regulator [Pelagibacterium sp. H642]WMT92140.1 LysR family transcriptional regulator [Pelagibacterium sp. H642]